MTPTTETPPISDPVFTVNGRPLVVIWGIMAQFRLSEWKIDAQAALNFTRPGSNDPGALFYAFTLFAAMVAHNYKPGEHAPTADEWVRIFGEDDSLRNGMFTAVGQALGKSLLASAKKMAAAQPATPIPAPSMSVLN